MLRVLLVKTSSLGDVVHNFPVASDIRQKFPDASIDWIVEEPFVSLVQMHPEVRRVIPVAVRRWRKSVLGPKTWSEVGEFRRLSQSEHYDAIIDSQGLIKSAVVARMAKGRLHGFDAASAREPLATRLYDVRHHVARGEHAVVRNRLLAAAALGYRLEPEVNYGIHAMAICGTERRFCVFLHGTSRSDKLWPEDDWVALGRQLNSMGISVILPWGSDTEQRRSVSLAAAIPGSSVPGRMTIAQMAELMRSSAFIVGVDTGLTHLAAALGCRVAALFVASDPRKTGVHGAALARNLGRIGSAPLSQDVMDALVELKVL
jgi:heptosyltransferase-1